MEKISRIITNIGQITGMIILLSGASCSALYARQASLKINPENHASYWKLDFSDWFDMKTGWRPTVTVDGKISKITNGKVNIPGGSGKHEIIQAF